MMLYTSVEQPPEPQQLLALVSLSCCAISAYFRRTMSLVSCAVVIVVGCWGLRRTAEARTISAAVVAHVGEQFVHVLGKGLPSLGVYAVADAGALHGALYQPRVLQFPQVLADGGLGQPDLIHQRPVDAAALLDQVLEDRDARRMAQHLGHGGHAVLFGGEEVGLDESHGG